MPSVAPRAALPPRRAADGRGGPSRGSGPRRPKPPPLANAAPPRTLLFCKPYDVLCSFTDAGSADSAPRATLKGAAH
jgi:hypothetical protein